MNIREAFIKVCVDRVNALIPSEDAEVIAARRKVAQSYIDQDDISFTMFKAGFSAANAEKGTVYLFSDDGCVHIAAFPVDHPDATECESYTFSCIEERMVNMRASQRSHSISVTVLRNVLERAGVRVVIE